MMASVCAAAGLVVSICGCEALSNYFGAAPGTPARAVASPAASSTPAPEATPEPSAETQHRRHARQHPAGEPQATTGGSSDSTGTASTDSISPPPNVVVPTVTLDNDQAARRRALGLLNSAHSKLGKVDRSKLSGDDAATYAQASTFADQAQQALGEHDYVAATGLAEKASLLADKVAAVAATPVQTGY